MKMGSDYGLRKEAFSYFWMNMKFNYFYYSFFLVLIVS